MGKGRGGNCGKREVGKRLWKKGGEETVGKGMWERDCGKREGRKLWEKGGEETVGKGMQEGIVGRGMQERRGLWEGTVGKGVQEGRGLWEKGCGKDGDCGKSDAGRGLWEKKDVERDYGQSEAGRTGAVGKEMWEGTMGKVMQEGRGLWKK